MWESVDAMVAPLGINGCAKGVINQAFKDMARPIILLLNIFGLIQVLPCPTALTKQPLN